MKALVLAAGFGTRLAPATERLPKPLFPILGVPVLGRMIDRLKRAGCTAVAVNTHHLADQVESYIERTDFGIPVHPSHEAEILGTGGAIRRLAAFWDREPFLVVNADLVTDIDLAGVYGHHQKGDAAVTLVMHAHDPFNQVWVDKHDRVTGFARIPDARDHSHHRLLAFTGIHVIDPGVVNWIPGSGFCDIIAVYQQMIGAGHAVAAHVVEGHYWQDMGSPSRFRDAVVDAMLPDVFTDAYPDAPRGPIDRNVLCGDGSDRKWFRFTCGGRRIVMADHGITLDLEGSEVNAFVQIGEHLYRCGLPVPRIYAHDGFSGLVFLEDLGDLNLQHAVGQNPDDQAVTTLYRQVIDGWLDLTTAAASTFDPAWTCQSETYDVPLVLEKECRYFVDAFLNGYCGMALDYATLGDEFKRLATRTIELGIPGLIHRDLQSRNIMIRAGHPYLIDFQGARHGPIQYDLASLLIDPYVALPAETRRHLLDHAAGQAAGRHGCSRDTFLKGYQHCVVTRNLQMLGAFGYLSRVKGKTEFATWIPRAAKMLAGHIEAIGRRDYPCLHTIAMTLQATK